MTKLYLDIRNGWQFKLASGPHKGKVIIEIANGYGTLIEMTDSKYKGQLVTDFGNFKIVDGPEPDVPNTAVIETICGQKMKFQLDELDEDQVISSVEVRGKTYVPQTKTPRYSPDPAYPRI